jgi:hypothetical protein
MMQVTGSSWNPISESTQARSFRTASVRSVWKGISPIQICKNVDRSFPIALMKIFSDVRLGFCILKMLDSMASETPHFFQGEMVPWLYLRIRRSKAGGMHLMNCKKHKTGKDLKCPAARLTGPVRPVLSRPFISLEKNGGSPMPGEPI